MFNLTSTGQFDLELSEFIDSDAQVNVYLRNQKEYKKMLELIALNTSLQAAFFNQSNFYYSQEYDC